ncbi:MAG: HAMP domain-containing sensor histidine kinase [Chloroflexota bacterium]
MTANMPRVEAAELTLHFELQPDLPWVRGERNQLAQVITNLLSNAIRYTPQGAIELQTVWDEEKGMVLTRITDTGIGIHPDDYDYLFDRFYRGQHTGQSNIPGTGFGSYNCQRNCRSARGRFWYKVNWERERRSRCGCR